MKLYLSFFTLARAIPLAKLLTNKINKVVESIVTPTDSDQMVDVVNDITADWESLIRTYVPRIGSIPMCQGITWSPSWKAVPSRGRKSDRALRDRDCRGKKESLSESVDHTLVGDRDTPYY